MKVIACYSIKGGVGKTASTVNLSYLSAREGFRTLIWDLDPQGASSFYYRIRPTVGLGAAGLVRDELTLDKVIKGTDYDNLDLVPSDFSYRNMDLFLDGEKKPKQRVEKLLKPLEEVYDYVFLDCPPGISLLSENVFMAADVLLVPLIPTTLSLRTLDQLVQFCQQEGLNDFSVLPFFTMVDARKVLHRRIVEELPKRMPSVLTNHIPYSSEIEQMGLRRAPVNIFAGHTRPAHCYEDLWWEIKVRLEWL